MQRSIMAAVAILWLGPGCAPTLQDLALRGQRGEFGELMAVAADGERPGWAREEAVALLGRHRAEGAGAVLARLLLDERESPWLRAAAAEALGNLRPGGCQETLEPLSQRAELDAEIRLAAIRSLCACMEDPERLQRTLSDLAQDADLLVAALADSLRRSRCAP